jgi:chromosome segregation ATPase
MESLVGEQKKMPIELQQYTAELEDLKSKFHQINAANDKLLDCLKNVTSTDEKSQTLLETLDTFQQYRQEMQSLIGKFERESKQIETKVKTLEVQNQQLLTSLNSYRIKMGNVDWDKRMELKAEIDELEKKLDMRDKSISRLYDKYEALRREYIKLYDFSAKGNKPKAPVAK